MIGSPGFPIVGGMDSRPGSRIGTNRSWAWGLASHEVDASEHACAVLPRSYVEKKDCILACVRDAIPARRWE